MSIPKVYSAIAAVTADLSTKGIPKRQINLDEQYAYRGIDDIYDRLSPLLAAHKLCVLPRVLERSSVDRKGADGDLLVNVSLRVAYHLVSAEDGSSHVIKSFGEALDAGDKATSKAMTAAFKSAILQTFCIPLTGSDEADAWSPRLAPTQHVPAPVQGWDQWTRDTCETLRVCESAEAIDRVQTRNRPLLEAVRSERPELFASIGDAIHSRRGALTKPAKRSLRPAKPANTPPPARKRSVLKREKVDA